MKVFSYNTTLNEVCKGIIETTFHNIIPLTRLLEKSIKTLRTPRKLLKFFIFTSARTQYVQGYTNCLQRREAGFP